MNHAAIPTAYNGVRFRSRLEARWACFFDLIQWKWAYEPIDLDGYIPDFILTDFQEKILVEVKPVLNYSELEEHRGKIERSGWKHEAIIVGAKIFTNKEADSNFDPIIGCLRNCAWGDKGWTSDDPSWDPCEIIQCSHNNAQKHLPEWEQDTPCGKWGPFSDHSGWICRACGMYGKHYGSIEFHEIERLWHHAGNQIQWRKPG